MLPFKKKGKKMAAHSTKGKLKTTSKFNKSQLATIENFLQFAQQYSQQQPPNQQAPQIQPPMPPRNIAQPGPLPFYPAHQPNALPNNPLNFDIDPILQRTRREFQEDTLPSLQSRFAQLGGGALESGGFKGLHARAQTDLQERLAQLQAQYQYQTAQQNQQSAFQTGAFNEGNRLQYGQANAQNFFQTGAYNQQTPINVGQQNIANMMQYQGMMQQHQGVNAGLQQNQQQMNQQGALGFGGLGLQSPYEHYYQAGQTGWMRDLMNGLLTAGGQAAGAAAGAYVGGKVGK